MRERRGKHDGMNSDRKGTKCTYDGRKLFRERVLGSFSSPMTSNLHFSLLIVHSKIRHLSGILLGTCACKINGE